MHGARNESQSKIGPPSCLKSNTSKSITENAETILKMKDNLNWHDFVEQLQLNLQCPVCYDPPYQPYTYVLFCILDFFAFISLPGWNAATYSVQSA
ncbi:hypothetical protein GYMLUDRAFT_244236 [Collybiopsis luxurians FD-317 M1]|uniref:Uncharacterized protein n=1 Tax=Collybiopsis luxurians FD-317 M1 TaxID=944289 RepID=A0A0D0CP91_9AGAR|nr:hypothetical protein GYMLUDRAFT_244236 [Collybiopsis luxurians FD-317 M1]